MNKAFVNIDRGYLVRGVMKFQVYIYLGFKISIAIKINIKIFNFKQILFNFSQYILFLD